MASRRGLIPGRAANDGRWLSQWFYAGVLALAWAQIFAFTAQPEYRVWPVLLGAIATAYTSFKMVQPVRWQVSKTANRVLLALDLSVCGALVILSGGPHSPFILFTLAPVVTAAMLLPTRYTVAVAAVTFGYVLAAFAIHASAMPSDVVADFNDFATYVVTLTLAAVLPYFVNARARQNVRAQAVLSERQKLAREIHDSLCQTIHGLRWQVQMLRHGMVPPEEALRDGTLDALVDKADADARDLISSLRSFRPGCSLVSELGVFLRKSEEECHITYELREDGQSADVDDLVKNEVLRICEEAVRNASRHSGCHHIAISLVNSDDELAVTVSDDGRGFEANKSAVGRGLTVMRERAESVGGRFELRSHHGGTEVRLEVPRRCPSELMLPVL